MDDRIKESISALMDGEADDLELQRLLSHVDHEELRETWAGYHRVGRALSVDGIALHGIDVSSAVSEALELDEIDAVGSKESSANDASSKRSVEARAEQHESPKTHSRSWGALSVAASIVMAVAVAFQYQGQTGEGEFQVGAPENVIAANDSPQLTALPEQNVQTPKVMKGFTDAHAKRFNEYLLRHSEYATQNGRQGVMPLARVASVNSVGI